MQLHAGPGQRARFDPARTIGTPPVGIAGYYADSLEAPGRWIGSGLGTLHRQGRVDANELEALLSGVHPDTGTEMIAAKGSANRAANTATRRPASRGPGRPTNC